MRTGERERAVLKRSVSKEEEERDMLTEKTKTKNYLSRASLYPVSSLSLSRAPCLLEENELPVAEWQEYDKAFTCVSRSSEKKVARNCFFFSFGNGDFASARKQRMQKQNKARPPPFSYSLLCLIPRGASRLSPRDSGMEFGSKESGGRWRKTSKGSRMLS